MMIKRARSRSVQCNNVMMICDTHMVHTQVQLNHVKQTSIYKRIIVQFCTLFYVRQ